MINSNATNEDCMKLMARYPDGYFDLAVVDPPYFSDYGKKNYTGNDISTTGVQRQTKQIKHWEVPEKPYFDELLRVSKNQIIWGCNYYASFIPHVGRIVWDKKNDHSTFSKAELASHSFGLIVDMFRFEWNGMLQGNMKNKEHRIHPTQKPVALYEWIFSKYAKQGDKILDTHLGSGSSRIAAHKAGLDFTACELDYDYFEAQNKRFDEYLAQGVLF